MVTPSYDVGSNTFGSIKADLNIGTASVLNDMGIFMGVNKRVTLSPTKGHALSGYATQARRGNFDTGEVRKALDAPQPLLLTHTYSSKAPDTSQSQIFVRLGVFRG